MGRTARFEMAADAKQVLNELQKVNVRLKDVEVNFGKLGDSSKRLEGHVGGLSGKFSQAGKELKNWVAGFVGIGAAVAMVKELAGALDEVNRKQVETAKSLRGFAAENVGNLDVANQEVKNLAARMKVKPVEAAQALQWAQAATGDSGKLRRRAAVEAIRLERADVDVEAGQDMMSQMMALGATPEQASAKTLRATQKLNIGAAGIGRMAAAAERFRSPDEALSVAYALQRAGGYTPKQFGGAVEAAGGVLYGDNALTRALGRKAKAGGGDIEKMGVGERLALIEGAGIDTSEAGLKRRYKIEGAESEALRKLISKKGEYGTELAAYKGLAPGLAAETVGALEGAPMTSEFFKAAAAESAATQERTYGATAAAASGWAAKRRQMGKDLKEYPLLVNETGEATWLGMGLGGAAKGAGAVSGAVAGAIVHSGPSPRSSDWSAIENLNRGPSGKTDERNTKATEDNTAAIRELNKKLGGGASSTPARNGAP
jgi:hypothetical protein